VAAMVAAAMAAAVAAVGGGTDGGSASTAKKPALARSFYVPSLHASRCVKSMQVTSSSMSMNSSGG
jgi:hypothetical protein